MRLAFTLFIFIFAAFAAVAQVELSERNRMMPVSLLFETTAVQQQSATNMLVSEQQRTLISGQKVLILKNNSDRTHIWTLTTPAQFISNPLAKVIKTENGTVTELTSSMIYWPIKLQLQQLLIAPNQHIELLYTDPSQLPTQLWSNEWLTYRLAQFSQYSALAWGAIVSILLLHTFTFMFAKGLSVWMFLTPLFLSASLICAIGFIESLSQPFIINALSYFFLNLTMLCLTKIKKSQEERKQGSQSTTLKLITLAILIGLFLSLARTLELLPLSSHILPIYILITSTCLILYCCYTLTRHVNSLSLCHLGICLFIGVFCSLLQDSASLTDKILLYLPVLGSCILGFTYTQIHCLNHSTRSNTAVKAQDMPKLLLKFKQLELNYRLLQEKNAIDFLTGLKNRQFFDERYHLELARSARENTPISLILIDLDHFKSVNDNYGHQVGDEVLKAVAKRFYYALNRPADAICRYGGEEFVILLPNTHIQGATHIAEQVSQAVSCKPISTTHGDICITISQGVSSTSHQTNLDTLRLLTLADEALYRAKSLGRNRFEVAVNKPYILKEQA